jgi:hypothetical protein
MGTTRRLSRLALTICLLGSMRIAIAIDASVVRGQGTSLGNCTTSTAPGGFPYGHHDPWSCGPSRQRVSDPPPPESLDSNTTALLLSMTPLAAAARRAIEDLGPLWERAKPDRVEL